MIALHRLGHQAETFYLNPDLVVSVESNPDTVVSLTTGTKIVVAEPAEAVIAKIRQFRVDVLSGAIDRRREGEPQMHATTAKRAAQGMLVSFDRTPTEAQSETEVEGATPRGVEPHGTEPRGVELHGAAPRGVEPRGVESAGFDRI